MRWRLLQQAGEKTFVIILETGDEVVAYLTDLAAEQKLGVARFTAIGAFSDVTLGYFEWERKTYRRIPVKEQVEVLSLVGDITREQGAPKVHAHVVLGKANGTAHGGHLLEAHVRPTLEVMLTEAPQALERRFDPASGLALIVP